MTNDFYAMLQRKPPEVDIRHVPDEHRPVLEALSDAENLFRASMRSRDDKNFGPWSKENQADSKTWNEAWNEAMELGYGPKLLCGFLQDSNRHFVGIFRTGDAQ